jgi:hypothetical protein
MLTRCLGEAEKEKPHKIFSSMNLRKWIRIIHRDTGYLAFGMTLIYGLSGIALNHLDDWNPDYFVQTTHFRLPGNDVLADVSGEGLIRILRTVDEGLIYKSHYYPDKDHLKIFHKTGSLTMNITTGESVLEILKKRPVFREVNFLHYNKPKKLWTWFSDLFAVSLIFLAISGIFMIKGRKGISGRGAWLITAGMIVPLTFLVIYLWA